MLASVRRYPCPAFSLPRPCWPKMIKCHQSTTPQRRAPPYWPSVARQHPWPGPPLRGGSLVALYHFWSARSGGGYHQPHAAEIHTPDTWKSWGNKICNISSRSRPLTILIILHLKWVRNETTWIFIFIKSTGSNQLQQPPLKQTG